MEESKLILKDVVNIKIGHNMRTQVAKHFKNSISRNRNLYRLLADIFSRCPSKFYDISVHGVREYDKLVSKYGARCTLKRGHSECHTDGYCLWSD